MSSRLLDGVKLQMFIPKVWKQNSKQNETIPRGLHL